MKKEVKPYTKKKSITILIIGVLGMLLAFASLFAGAIMQSKGVVSAIYLPFCIVFFPICVADIIFLVYHQPGIVMRDIKKQHNKNNDFEIIENANFDVEKLLETKKFKVINEGYLYKKKISFLKDYINYYVKKCESINIEETIDLEYKEFDKRNFKCFNKCLILFIEKEQIADDDLKIVSKISNIFIASEILPQVIRDTSVIVLLNRSNHSAYIVRPGQNKISFYNCGYKLVKKILLNK